MEEYQKIAAYERRRRRRKIWRKIVQFMACIVVFCTTYALILPAITMEKEYVCGIEPHEHTDSCYTSREIRSYHCIPQGELHLHEPACFDSQGMLICPFPVRAEHTHVESCFVDGVPMCGRKELQLHSHDAACKDENGNLICGLPELSSHVHGESCTLSEWETVLSCSLPVHTHTESCKGQPEETTTITENETFPGDEDISEAGETEPTEPTLATQNPETAEPEPTVTEETDASQEPEATEPEAPEETKGPPMFAAAPSKAATATVKLELYSYNEWNPVNFSGGNSFTCEVGSTITLTLNSGGANYNAPKLTVTGGQLISQSYTCGQSGHSHRDWCVSNPTHTIVIRVTGTNVSIAGQIDGSHWTNSYYSITPPESGGTEPTDPPTEPTDPPTEPTDPPTEPTDPPTEPTDPPTEPTDPPTEPTEPEIDTSYPNYPNYPHAVHTGSVSINRLRFYNLCEGNGGISALPGCEFLITGNNGYSTTIISGNDPEIHLPANIPNGDYTIEEISVPEGYLRDTRYRREFQIRDGMLVSEHNIGTFINHNVDRITRSKTGEVEDYNNRIYQILLAAESNIRMYEMEPIHVLFVVDQSNSMLFPAGMNSTGKSLTLRLDGSGNITRNQAVLDSLDKKQVYYVVADPAGSATAWAIWYDGHTWMCQDASYYAKAKHNNAEGYQTPDELAIFPEDKAYSEQRTTENGKTARVNGGALAKNLAGSSLGKDIDKEANDIKTYTLYTSKDPYNRLHYLEESLANIVYALADANPQNKITLVPFTKTVQTTIPDPDVSWRNMSMPVTLTTTNAEKLVKVVTGIDTSGGTRQDLALQYTYDTYLRDGKAGTQPDHTYTILITDGAPVQSDDNKSLDQIYRDINTYGTQVKQYSTLMSVALGMDTVVGGSQALKNIATSDRFYCALEDASELMETMQDVLFEGFTMKERIAMKADLTDEITDAFYPIAWTDRSRGASTGRRVLLQDSRDWILLQSGDWITIEGKYTTGSASNAAGQLLRKEDGTFYIQWKDLPISDEGGWKGTFYVKAKEDFLGGNAILTNKSATLVTEAVGDLHPSMTVELPSPTVNVRLLDRNQLHSEVTVYLGDSINPVYGVADGSMTQIGTSPMDSILLFYDNTRVYKILSGSGDVLNATDSADGLADTEFTLKYAMGRDLTAEEWQQLRDGQTVTIPYIYDEPSSKGNVGEFRFRLEKTGIAGSNPGFGVHEATAACQSGGQPLTQDCDTPAETYTLIITYEAYRLGANGRPSANVNNGTGSPGTEVGTGATLETGLGIVEKENIHEVHVISGVIQIVKRFAEGVTSDQDQTFTFLLHRMEDGEDTSRDMIQSITIPAGQPQGASTVTFSNLRRGTYTVAETPSEVYMVESIQVLDTTNCYSIPAPGGSAQSVTFTMGRNTANADVIGRESHDAVYTSYLDPVNGVYGAAVFTNKEITYEGQIPVSKQWDDGVEKHGEDTVYVLLCLDGTPVLDSEGRGKLLKLSAANNWQGSFTVPLADKHDVVTNYRYSVREVYRVSNDSAHQEIWYRAILENDGTTVLYYDRALEDGSVLAVHEKAYVVHYTPGEAGAWTVTNHRGSELPATGGTGTYLYTIGGSLLSAAALIMGCSQRRRRERRASG